jgi:two-component system, OmpR family, sensor histidine kinase SenX3
MVVSDRNKKIAFFITLCVLMVVIVLVQGVSLMVLNWRTGLLAFFGVVVLLLIVAGVVLNTIFLVREIRRNEQHDAFLNAVTHELKTPVASIRLYLETLQKHNVEEAKRQEFYGIMLADSDRLLSTIEQVLRAAGTAAHSKQLLHRERLDLGELVEEVLALARMRHHLPPEALQYATGFAPPERPVVMGDAAELRAAISNLVDNAIKYSSKNVRVLVRVDRQDARNVTVRVRDNGLGIPPEELKRIFKRFYRIPGAISARIKGTGLGLFIVRSVAERHGGRAWAESAGDGQGSTFVLQLPAAVAA